MTSAAGATLTRLADGSILAGGRNPAVDTYVVEALTPLAGITGLRLEAIPDPNMPHHGSGRHPDSGNFHLDAIRLSAAIDPGGAAPVPVRMYWACVDYADRRPGYTGASGTLDTDPSTFWSIWPETHRRHWAIFQIDPPIGTSAGTRLRVELDCQTASPHSVLGRFRLSVTNRPVPSFRASLTRLKTNPVRNGLTRSGAAYYLLGDWAAAASILERAAARPGAPHSTASCWPGPPSPRPVRRGPERLRSRPRASEDRAGRGTDPRRRRRGADGHPGPGPRPGRLAPARRRVPRQPVRSMSSTMARGPSAMPTSQASSR